MRQITEENQMDEVTDVVFMQLLKMVQVQPHICGIWSCKVPPKVLSSCSGSASPDTAQCLQSGP